MMIKCTSVLLTDQERSQYCQLYRCKLPQPSKRGTSRWTNNLHKRRRNKYCSIAWNLSKIKRVLTSLLAAEALALSDGCGTSFFISQIVNHIYQKNINTVLANNKILKDTIQSTDLISDKRLRAYYSSLWQMHDRSKIEIKWIATRNQVSNVLTKREANRHDLTYYKLDNYKTYLDVYKLINENWVKQSHGK